MPVPGYQFSAQLFDIIDKARANALLPPASRMASPTLESRGENDFVTPSSTDSRLQDGEVGGSMFCFDLPAALDFSPDGQPILSDRDSIQVSFVRSHD